MIKSLMFAVVIALLLTGGLVSCEKESGDAVVLAKEHIAAALPIAETPNAQSASTPDEQPRPIADDDITVDGYVMKPEARGTSRDPRALKAEQWLVKVRMIEDGRTFNVQAEQAQFDKLKEGDRVTVRYRIGKYTKTVWGSEIEQTKK
jgi:hypothetical protein